VHSLGEVVDKEAEEEVREEVPSLDPMLGARVNDLAKLLTCVLIFWCAGYLFLRALSLTVNVRHAVLPKENSIKHLFFFSTHPMIPDICFIVHTNHEVKGQFPLLF